MNANKKLSRYAEIFKLGGCQVKEEQTDHIVFVHERFQPATYNHFVLKIVDKKLWFACMVNGVHQVQEQVKDKKHCETLFKEWVKR